MELTPVTERFVLHWGEMGARWGVNRSVAQIHALLYLAARPMAAEEIADTLGIARSNVSTSLKELQGWGLVSIVHAMGDRRDLFETRQDLWDLLTTVVEERKRREIDPTLSVLRQCVLDAEGDGRTDAGQRARIARMLEFLETLTAWYDQVKRLPKPTLVKLMKLGGRIARFVGGGG